MKDLAKFACNPQLSKGRLHSDTTFSYSDNFQTDINRIIQSNAFRRLQYKTQVFCNHEGDHFRSRLTHSIEVAEIASTISHALFISYSLARSISLAHDLGHAPFGHSGEDALNECMKDYGGFNHNVHTIKIVTQIEKRYQHYNGLNLTWESLEGLVKHNGILSKDIPKYISEYNKIHDLKLNQQSSLEAQVSAISDDIAYISHDLEDGLRYGLIKTDQLKKIPLLEKKITHQLLNTSINRIAWEVSYYLYLFLIDDVISTTNNNFIQYNIKTYADVIKNQNLLVSFSTIGNDYIEILRKFLLDNMYHHPHILDIYIKCQTIIKKLFNVYMNDINLIPLEWKTCIVTCEESNQAQVISDYIACMTDRYAITEFYTYTGLQFNDIKL